MFECGGVISSWKRRWDLRKWQFVTEFDKVQNKLWRINFSQKLSVRCNLPFSDTQFWSEVNSYSSQGSWRKFKCADDWSENCGSQTSSETTSERRFEDWTELNRCREWQQALQWQGLPNAKQTLEVDLWADWCWFTREKSSAIVKPRDEDTWPVAGRNFSWCWDVREAERLTALAALDSALWIFYSFSTSSARSWCLYSNTVFQPYGDLSASNMSFWRSWRRAIPLYKASCVISRSFVHKDTWASSTASVTALLALKWSSLLFLLKLRNRVTLDPFDFLHLLRSRSFVGTLKIWKGIWNKSLELRYELFVTVRDHAGNFSFIHGRGQGKQKREN